MKRASLVVSGVAVLALSLFHPMTLSASPGMGTLYGTDASGGDLLVINTTTGAGTLVGPIDEVVIPSLATDPVTGILYAGGGGGNPLLFRVDPNTGAGTLVGDTGLGLAAIGAMDFREFGFTTKPVLYAAVNIVGDGGTGSDHLATIDTATGIATVIGPFGSCDMDACSIEGMEAIAFAQDGTLFGALTQKHTGTPGLYTIDPSTGAATFVAPILNGAGAPPAGGVVSLQFACDGTLFGGTTRSSSNMVADGGDLVTINPTTGVFTLIGNAVSGGNALGALAFAHGCQSRGAPTLSFTSLAALFVGLGALGLLLLRRRFRAA